MSPTNLCLTYPQTDHRWVPHLQQAEAGRVLPCLGLHGGGHAPTVRDGEVGALGEQEAHDPLVAVAGRPRKGHTPELVGTVQVRTRVDQQLRSNDNYTMISLVITPC
jgi:hypothetical protein